MGKVIASAVVSIDGFVADTEDAYSQVPVVFGTGVRFFGDYSGAPVLLDNPTVVEGDRVTHLHYRVSAG